VSGGGIHFKGVGHPLDPWESLLRVPASKVTAAVLDEGSATGTISAQATNSVTPSANKLLLLTVVTATVGGAATPSSVTGNGLTWVAVNDVAAGNVRVTVYRSMGASPSAGAVTINYGVAQTNVLWQVAQFSNVNTTGTNGSGAVVQSAVGSANSPTVTATLAAAPSLANMVTGHLAHNSTTAAPTPGSNAAILGTQATLTSPSVKRFVQANPAPANAVQGCTNPSSGNYGFIAVEILAA
jgi:hypothetical protein